MKAGPLRLVVAAAAVGSIVLFFARTAPNFLDARASLEGSRRDLDRAESLLRTVGSAESRVESGISAEEWRARGVKDAAFLAGGLDGPAGDAAALARERVEILRRLSGPELPESLLAHLFPAETWERAGREPGAAELAVAWRKFRIAAAAVGSLVEAGVQDVGFLTFPGAGSVEPDSSGIPGVSLKIRYAGPAATHARAYASLVGRRERGPFFLPTRLLLAGDPAGGGSDRIVVLLEARVPLPGRGGP